MNGIEKDIQTRVWQVLVHGGALAARNAEKCAEAQMAHYREVMESSLEQAKAKQAHHQTLLAPFYDPPNVGEWAAEAHRLQLAIDALQALLSYVETVMPKAAQKKGRQSKEGRLLELWARIREHYAGHDPAMEELVAEYEALASELEAGNG